MLAGTLVRLLPRKFSIAPTEITFFAVAGETIESGTPPEPPLLPTPLLPTAKT